MPDDKTIEEFVRRLANASVMNSHDTGFVIVEYWKDEAVAWVKKLDEPGDPDYDEPCKECGK